MKSCRRQLRAVAVVIVALASGCSSNKTPTAGRDQDRAETAGDLVAERALVACFQDNGIDAELLADGSVLSDKNGTLSLEESRALTERCYQRLADEGTVDVEASSDELIKRNYAAFQALRDCLIDEGYSIPELVSFELFAAKPELFVHPLEVVVRTNGVEAYAEASTKCPPP